MSSLAWMVDFSLEVPPFDITDDMGGQAFIPEAAATDAFPPGDGTAAEPLHLPTFQASVAHPFDDLVQGDGWVPDAPLLIEVNPGGSPGPVVPWMTDPGGNWRVNPLSEGLLPPGELFDLAPGDLVRVTQDTVVKETVLVGLTLDVFDPGSEVVGGSSDQADTTPVEVGVGNEFGGANASTTVSSLAWMVDFSLEVPPFDITDDMGGQAFIPEAAATDAFPPGDGTAAEPVQHPVIRASLTGNWIEGYGFPANSPVDIMIGGSPSTPPTSDHLFTDEGGNFNADPGFLEGFFPGLDLVSGMLVEVDVVGIAKDLTLIDLAITDVDFIANTVGGSSNQTVPEEIQARVDDVSVVAPVADGSGAPPAGSWFADFAPFDVTPAKNIQAEHFDAEGDATVAEPYFLRISASVTSGWIGGQGFAPDAVLEIDINGACFPWGTDPGGNFFADQGSLGSPPLNPGDVITVSDLVSGDPCDTGTAGDTRVLVVDDLHFAGLRADTDVAFGGTGPGIAPGGAGVEINVDGGGMSGGFGERAITDVDGNWFVDIGVAHGQDVQADWEGQAQSYEDDGDSTIAEKSAQPFDLEVVKTGPASATAGDGDVVHTVTVTNLGPAFASGVELVDTVTIGAAGATVASVVPSPDTDWDGTDRWMIHGLEPAQSATLTITYDVPAGAGAGLVDNNVVFANSNEEELGDGPGLGPNDAAVATAIGRVVDIAVTKAVVGGPVQAGSGAGNLVYTVTATNDGPSDATNVTIEDVLTPLAGVSLDSGVPSTGSFDIPSSTWTIPSLADGASATLDVVVTVGASVADGAVVTNTATYTGSDEVDSNPANDMATVDAPVIRAVDIVVTKSASDPSVVAGTAGGVTVTVTATNMGPSDASGVEIIDVLILPAGATVTGTTPSVGAFDGTTWTVGDLAMSASATLTFTVTVASDAADGAVVTNWAFLSAVDESDTVMLNDFDSASVSVVRMIDIGLTKTESSDPVVAGGGPGNLVYTVTAENHGPSDASNVKVSEVLTTPAGVTVDSVVPSAGTFTNPNWVFDLASGSSATLTIKLTVGDTAAGGAIVSDTATFVSANETDTVPGNNTVAEDTTILNRDDYNPLTPFRIVDTRTGVPGGLATPWTAGLTRSVQVTGGAVPANASAVVLQVTADSPTAQGFMSVFPTGAALPVASSLNFTSNTVVLGDQVIATVGAGGMVDIFNSAGEVDLLIDVVGYFAPASGDGYNPLTPFRIVDTRTGVPGGLATPWTAGLTRSVQVTGGAVPANASAVVLQVTADSPTAQGFMSVFPTGAALPVASSLNFTSNTVVLGDQVIATVGAGGMVDIFNSAGEVDLLIDVVGYFAPASGDGYNPLTPFRIVDTRTGVPGGLATPWTAGLTRSVQVTGGAVPANASAVVLQVTADSPTAQGFMSVFPTGAALPVASSLNFTSNTVVLGDQVIATVGAGGMVDIFNSAGEVDLLIDVVGYYSP